MVKAIEKRYWVYLLSLALNIFLVIFIFRSITPKNKAALFAGSLFVSISLLIILGEFLYGLKWRSLSFTLATLFMVVFSLPMLLVRAMNYDVDFSSLSVWGMSAPMFHGVSNFGYIILILGVVFDAWKNRNLR